MFVWYQWVWKLQLSHTKLLLKKSLSKCWCGYLYTIIMVNLWTRRREILLSVCLWVAKGTPPSVLFSNDSKAASGEPWEPQAAWRHQRLGKLLRPEHTICLELRTSHGLGEEEREDCWVTIWLQHWYDKLCLILTKISLGGL